MIDSDASSPAPAYFQHPPPADRVAGHYRRVIMLDAFRLAGIIVVQWEAFGSSKHVDMKVGAA
jgi:hypothetical protein